MLLCRSHAHPSLCAAVPLLAMSGSRELADVASEETCRAPFGEASGPCLAVAQAAAAFSASSRRSNSTKAVPLGLRVPLSMTSLHAASLPKRASRSCAQPETTLGVFPCRSPICAGTGDIKSICGEETCCPTGALAHLELEQQHVQRQAPHKHCRLHRAIRLWLWPATRPALLLGIAFALLDSTCLRCRLQAFIAVRFLFTSSYLFI